MTKFVLLSPFVVLLPAGAVAQSVPQSQNQTQDVVVADWLAPIVVTATRAPQNPSQVGQSVTTIDAAQIEAQQTVVLSDLLATTTGVTVTRNGGVGGTTSLFIRGASSEQTLVVIDGVPVNDASSPSGGYDFSTLLAGDVSRVEILRGADSVPWGSAAIGGVVNITTVGPTLRLSSTVSAEGGSYGTVNLNSHVSDTFGPLGVVLGGGWTHTSGISAFAASEGGKEADGFDQHYANARVTLRLNSNFWLDLRGRYARSFAMIDGYNTPTGSFGDDAEYSITREQSGYAALHDSFKNGAFTDTYAYSITNIHRDTYDPQDTYDATGLPGFEFGYRGQVERLEYQGTAQPLQALKLVYGAESERSSLASPADIYGDPAASFRTGIDSGYGQIILTPVTQLTVTGGVRYDHHRAFGGHVTTSANAAWHVTDSTTLRASYAEGFKAPTLYQLYAPYYGTPTLQPETATSFDGGIEQHIGRGLSLRATYFNRRTNNLIDFNPATFTYANIAAARAHGVEMEGVWRITANITAAANYTHTASTNPLTGLDLARRPRDVMNLTIDGGLWHSGPKLGATLSYNGPRFDDAANSVRLGSYWLASVHAAYPLNAHLELYGRVENLFDSQYQVVRHYGTLGRAAYAGVRVKL